MRIVLADPGHNQLTLSSDVYPLAIANLASYATSQLKSVEPLDITLVREPEDLRSILDSGVPDVLGLSSYAWNHELSLHFAAYAKNRRPDALVLMGGPNFPLSRDEQEAFLRGMEHVDVAVRGPTYEGERAFVNIIRRFSEVECRIDGVFDGPVPGNIWIDPRTGEFVDGGCVDRIENLDEIPSPYLGGWLDPFFETGYFPLMQIARGCPFSCQFCNSAVADNNRVHAHSIENVKADLLYIAQRVSSDKILCLADDNFGMYARDEEIADYLSHLQVRHGWPRYIRTTTGKNQPERIIRVMRKTGGAMPMTSAVQSLNPDVLENIQRANIKLDTYSRIQDELKAQGMQSYGELILCLPGETRSSFMNAIRDLMDSGVKRISAHQLMLMNGAPLSSPESRDRFQFDTRFRVVARNFGDYTGEPVIEIEEMVVATPTFTFEEYLEARVFHLLLTIYYYEGNFEEAFEFAAENGVSAYTLATNLQEHLHRAPRGLQSLVEHFVEENRAELHPSREACRTWGQEHFSELMDGTYGDNLLAKYSMIGRFNLLQETLTYLETVVEIATGTQPDTPQAEMLQNVTGYLHSVLLHVPFRHTLLETPRWTTRYDIAAWRDSGYERPLESHKLGEERTYLGHVPEERARLIQGKVETFGELPSGLGKFTRTMFAHDMRRSLVEESAVKDTATADLPD